MQRIILSFVKSYASNGIRHIGTAAAGFLVGQGVIGADQQAAAVGAIVFLLTSLWSWAEKRGLLEAAFA